MHKNWTRLQRPKSIEVVKETDTYGHIRVEPLPNGYGITLGNALRRVLLSSIRGAAITKVRIEGIGGERVLHEFQSLTGVKEDITEVFLNLKGAVFALKDEGPKRIVLEKDGPGEVTVGDFKQVSGLEIINPGHHIATLTKGGRLMIEAVVEDGVGYLPTEKRKHEEKAEDELFIDAIFTPMKKVNYTVSNARVGQDTNYDRLDLEVWTDGSVKPGDAVAISAKILKEMFQFFINFDESEFPGMVEGFVSEESTKDNIESELNENLNRMIEEMELSPRAINCLTNAGIKYIGELVQLDEQELLKMKNFGRKSFKEVKELLQDMGLSLGMRLKGWKRPEPEGSEEK